MLGWFILLFLHSMFKFVYIHTNFSRYHFYLHLRLFFQKCVLSEFLVGFVDYKLCFSLSENTFIPLSFLKVLLGTQFYAERYLLLVLRIYYFTVLWFLLLLSRSLLLIYLLPFWRCASFLWLATNVSICLGGNAISLQCLSVVFLLNLSHLELTGLPESENVFLNSGKFNISSLHFLYSLSHSILIFLYFSFIFSICLKFWFSLGNMFRLIFQFINFLSYYA